MTAVLITFDQAHYERIITLLDRLSCRGFTSWRQVEGRGSNKGEPHYGSHAWPSLASAIITMVDTEKAPVLLEALKAIDEEAPRLGLRAFSWPITAAI